MTEVETTIPEDVMEVLRKEFGEALSDEEVLMKAFHAYVARHPLTIGDQDEAT